MFSAAHSIAFRIQINPCVPCSTATKVDNVTDTPTCHTDSALLMHSTASAYKQITSAMLSSDQVAATHNMTSSLDQHALHTHAALYPPTSLPFTTFLRSQITNRSRS